MEIQRKVKNGSSKLVTELRLYRSLYEADRLLTKIGNKGRTADGEEEKAGVPAYEIRQYTDASQRTLGRYLRELVLSGAVINARFLAEGQYCLARFGEPREPQQIGSSSMCTHLRRLARTCALMKMVLDGDGAASVKYIESVQPKPKGIIRYTELFFDSPGDAEMWLYTLCWFEDVTYRTLQRDMKAVWEAISGYEIKRGEMQ